MAALVPLTPAQSYSSEEWEVKRPIITQLYRDEGKSLNNVRATLAQQYGFRPTKWNIERKLKEADMLFAVRIALERQSQGKEIEFLIRGRAVSLEDVKRYFKRKGVDDLKSLAPEAAAAVPTTLIICRSPGRSYSMDETAADALEFAQPDLDIPSNVDPGGTSLVKGSAAASNNIQRTHLKNSLEYLENLLHFGRVYYDSVFSDPERRRNESYFEVTSLEVFFRHMQDGQLLLEQERFAAALTEFDRAFDQFHEIL